MTNRESRECRLCHRIGQSGYVPAGGENHIYECSNDRACVKRANARQLRDARWQAAQWVRTNIEGGMLGEDIKREEAMYQVVQELEAKGGL